MGVSIRVGAMALLCAWGGGLAWADEGEGEERGEPENFLARVLAFENEMKEHGEPPVEEGPDRVLYHAWRKHLKPRSKDLASRTHALGQDSLWVYDDESGAATHLEPKQWTKMISLLGKLYTGLGAALKSYEQVAVSPDQAIRAWDRKHPEPRTTGLTPSGHVLVKIKLKIKHLKILGKPIPITLQVKYDHYFHLTSQELEYRREAHRRWVEDRRQAHLDIRAHYAEIRVYIQTQLQVLIDQMTAVRKLAFDLQRAEEDRLRAWAATFPEGDKVHEDAKRILKEMAKGRQRALAFHDDRTSRWGTMLRQKWMVQRGWMLRAIKNAERRQSDAAANAEAPEPAAPEQGDGG